MGVSLAYLCTPAFGDASVADKAEVHALFFYIKNNRLSNLKADKNQQNEESAFDPIGWISN